MISKSSGRSFGALIWLTAAAGCWNSAANEGNRPSSVPAAPAVAKVETPGSQISATPVAAAAADEVFELPGTAAPSRTTLISTKSSGILRALKAREGDRVSAGQVICVLDPTDLNLRNEAAAIALAQAQEAIQNAKNDLARAEQLHEAKALPNQALEKTQLALRLANLQAQGAGVALRMARQALADTQIRAPFAGVITKLLAEEGQMITTMPPTMILVLADTATLEVRVPIPERRLAQFKPGLTAVVRLPAMNVERQAKIDRIAEVVDPVTRSAEAIIRLDNRDHALPAGLYARVRFPTVPAEDTKQLSGEDNRAESATGGR